MKTHPIPWLNGAGKDTGNRHAVEAIFTPEVPTQPIALDSLDIVAQSPSVVFSTGQMWKTDAYSSLGIEPIPDNSLRFSIHAGFPAGVESGRMYLWQI